MGELRRPHAVAGDLRRLDPAGELVVGGEHATVGCDRALGIAWHAASIVSIASSTARACVGDAATSPAEAGSTTPSSTSARTDEG